MCTKVSVNTTVYIMYHTLMVRENLPGHFKFKEYCPRVFHDLRKRFEVDDYDYMVSSFTYMYMYTVCVCV